MPAEATPEVTSIYQQALGAAFKNLHPQIQRRFGFSSADGIGAIGTGVMSSVWHGPAYTLPFLYLGTWRRIMFPESGTNIPFSIENYAFVDPFGRETVTWVRTFHAQKQRRFDAYMIYAPGRRKIVDYLGSHEHLAVDIDLSVSDNGGLRLRSGEQRFYEGFVGFAFPMAISGAAEVCEWFDDAEGKFRIDVHVSNRRFGPLFGYSGAFDVEWIKTSRPPREILPKRFEKRE